MVISGHPKIAFSQKESSTNGIFYGRFGECAGQQGDLVGLIDQYRCKRVWKFDSKFAMHRQNILYWLFSIGITIVSLWPSIIK
jgi:hypothetical protein